MNLPSYIRTMLQVNYYVSEEDLNKQFFEMPDAVKQLITSKCMINGKFKTEEELASVSHEQMLEDIDSDIPLHNPTTNTSDNDYTSKSSINNFVNNKTAFDSYVKKAVSSSSNELEEVSSLLAVKRLCNSDSKTFSISFDEYEKAKKEVYTELVVKDWMTRYIDSHPMTKKNAETYQQNIAETTAMIHQMVSTNKEADIAKRFDIPTDEKTVSELRGATLAVAMSEVTCFANKIKDKVDQSSFVKEVKRLDNSFKEKYPKTYCVSKIVGSLGAGIALGPVCSAFRAATTINGMRKDYAKIKEIEGEKASFWKYMRSKEGRQKLMTTGQNFLRMIPGVRPLGMAIGAIKNSDGLVSSVKDVKKNGGNKQRWAKIAGCTIGLLAVSAAAAYANDDVADAVNSFVGEHITPTLEHMAEAINIGNHDVDLSNVDTSSPSIDVSDVHSNLAENANIGDISPELASNSVADNIEHLSWAERFKNFISGKSSNSDSLTENAHLNVDATENGVQVVAHNDGSFARIDEVDGKVNASGAINQTARLGEDGVTLTHAYGDTQTGDVGAEITLNQSGAKIYANHYGAEDLHDNAGVDFEVGKSVRVDGTGFHARAGSLNIGEDRTLDTSLDANSHGVVADATMRHNGDNLNVDINTTNGSGQAVHFDDNSFQRVDVADGKINASGAFNQTARLGEDGVTLTHAHGDTQTGDVGAEITLNQSGAKIYANHYGAEDLHDNAGVDFEVGKSVRVDGTGFHARAGSLNIGEDRTLDTSLDANSHGVVADATMRHNGDNLNVDINTTNGSGQVVHFDDNSFQRVDVADGKINASGAFNQTARLGEDGVTLTHAHGDTQTGDVGAEITLNQSGAKIYANHYGAEDLHDNAGVDFEVGKSVRVDGTGFHARAGSLNIGEDRTLDTSLDANSHGVVADATMRHNGDNLNVDINTTNGSGQVVHFDDNSFQRIDVADGKVNASGAFNQTARLGEDGITLTHAHGDTQTGDVGAEITLNQSGAKVYANHYGAEDLHDNAGIDFEVGKSVRVDGTGFHARAGSVDLGNNTTMDSALDVDKQGTIADTKIRHDGDVKSFHFDTHNNSAQQVHMDDTGSYQKVEVNNGKVEGSYSVNRTVDTSKPGTTVTHSSMDSKGNAKFRIVDNQSGKGVTVTRNDDHSAQITFEDGNNGTSKIRINQNGQMFVAGEDGNLYKVSDTRQVANIAGKLLGGLLKGRGR